MGVFHEGGWITRHGAFTRGHSEPARLGGGKATMARVKTWRPGTAQAFSGVLGRLDPKDT